MTPTASTTLNVQERLDAMLDALLHECSLTHEASDTWPVAPGTTALVDGCIASSQSGVHSATSVLEVPNGIARVTVGGGFARVVGHGGTPQGAVAALDAVRQLVPRDESSDPETIPVTFWTYSPQGARSKRRELNATTWTGIVGNYTEQTSDRVGRLMAPDFRPGVGGQLILWSGDPGTGKTTALLALGREWREWADLHYVVDPEHFFGAHADYMMDVFAGGQNEQLTLEDGTPKPRRWRVLVLEDCGEMLQPDARQQIGQALSRFLNACNGLITRGQRVLVLVTTNEPVEKLHPAVSRHGRCAARVDFERFENDEAQAWLRERGAELPDGLPTPTLADLYSLAEGFRQGAQKKKQRLGFGLR